MEFTKSKYYNEEFLGKNLYARVSIFEEALTVQEYFGINDIQKEYHRKEKYKEYTLKVYEDYYELNCSKCDVRLYLIFDKPVHITGAYCKHIIAPEIVIKTIKNVEMTGCVAENVTIDNKNKIIYEINCSKINQIYFYNSKVHFWYSEINAFFIFDKDLVIDNVSKFLHYHKIKTFGKCSGLKKKMLNDTWFKQGIVHIE